MTGKTDVMTRLRLNALRRELLLPFRELLGRAFGRHRRILRAHRAAEVAFRYSGRLHDVHDGEARTDGARKLHRFRQHPFADG
jgi:hypothetical protein